jgi:hypothetical protein
MLSEFLPQIGLPNRKVEKTDHVLEILAPETPETEFESLKP